MSIRVRETGMNTKKTNLWRNYLTNIYNDFIKEQRNYRCRIIGIETDQATKEVVLLVIICGIKNQIVSYFPKELVLNDTMLSEFSPFDVRAITFFSLLTNIDLPFVKFSITGQEFVNGKTIFIIKELNMTGENRRSAQELYCDATLLDQFSRDDLINIISTAIQEQTIEDLQKIG